MHYQPMPTFICDAQNIGAWVHKLHNSTAMTPLLIMFVETFQPQIIFYKINTFKGYGHT